MGQRYQDIAFGPRSRERQCRVGSDVAYGEGNAAAESTPQDLSGREIAMLTGVFQFHLATVTPSGWPYVQYRSGPRGFLHHLGGNHIGFADFHGNQQFVSVGNLESDGRVALFLADFPRKRRLKLFGRAQVVEARDDPHLLDVLQQLDDGRIAARCERSIVIDIEAFDWNCSRSLVPQYTADEVRERTEPYIAQIKSLQDEVTALRARLDASAEATTSE